MAWLKITNKYKKNDLFIFKNDLTLNSSHYAGKLGKITKIHDSIHFSFKLLDELSSGRERSTSSNEIENFCIYLGPPSKLLALLND